MLHVRSAGLAPHQHVLYFQYEDNMKTIENNLNYAFLNFQFAVLSFLFTVLIRIADYYSAATAEWLVTMIRD